ncbi:hypothetical protein ILYODFUR_005911 [Ilyodon furcidens]|uniref:Uncharacterized protein n=1 Tax=Ilyodon furcidens TaxID=33524 RepID=A0ABV0VBG6_9TELE
MSDGDKGMVQQNVLHLNSSKIEAIQMGTPYQIRQQKILSITFSGQNIYLSSTVTNLGAILYLSTAQNFPTLMQKSLYTFVYSRFRFCYALLFGNGLDRSGAKQRMTMSRSSMVENM